MENVYVAAVGMIPFGKHPGKSVKDLSGMVLAELFKDTDLTIDQLQAVWFANAGWGGQIGQHSIRGQVALMPHGIGEIPVMNVENACAGGSSAFYGATLGIKSGEYDIALALGAEKMAAPGTEDDPKTRAKALDSFIGGTDVEETVKLLNKMKEEADRLQAESGGDKGGEKKARSPFMDMYSADARAHMEKYGTTQRQIAAIAAKNHYHGSLNPLAQYRFDMSIDDVLNDRMVSYPLTRAMCSPLGEGAAATILVSERMKNKLGLTNAVKVRASVLTSAKLGENFVGPTPPQLAYERAGLGPDDIDVAEVHDATAVGEMLQTEKLGFCAVGEGGAYAESGATKLGGAKPVNPSGGLECRGHPIGATGLAQVAELTWQLRGQAGDRQVEGARIAIAENGGGFVETGDGAAVVTILEGASN
ncbi:thiolase family protein [Ruegeria halocynthiae]|uniref:thiolase family protein n=1 Tax=Ruegeria halocynthiae TaxID=985054 RepID=UPI0005672DCC|nr:thiolase family protein [Ruegeria halocynthiae]